MHVINGKYVFQEKGVDVNLISDIIFFWLDKKIKEAFICSSDSDLIPAIRELRQRGLKITYIGFQNEQNIGLAKNCDKTFLIDIN